MEQSNTLGLYISRNSATAVVLSGHGSKPSVLACFTVKVTDLAEPSEYAQAIASEISDGLKSRQLSFSSVSAAVDCSLFTQHSHQSSFVDPKQIAQTIRFDAEEAVAADAMDLAVTFNVTKISETGSNVTIFSADRYVLGDILSALQAMDIDPTSIEPDVVCAARFLDKNVKHPNQENCLFTLIAPGACYIIHPSAHNAPATRTFLLESSQNNTATIARELPMTIASMNSEDPINAIMLAGNTDTIDCGELEERTSLDIGSIDLINTAAANPSVLDDNTSSTDFAIAYGAALSEIKKSRRTDFRQDFMPYQGRKMIIQKCVMIMSISITIMLLAAGGYFQTRSVWANQNSDAMQEKLETEYAAVMYGNKPPNKKEPIAEKLKRELVKVRKAKSGLASGDDNSTPAKLSYVLACLNDPTIMARIDVEVKEINIRADSIKVVGSTKRRNDTLQLFKAINKHPRLTMDTSQFSPSGGRDVFTANIKLNR